MSESTSGIISQQLQQAQGGAQTPNPAQPSNGKSFEAHLQDKARGGDAQTRAEKPDADTQSKLDQIQA